MEEHLIPYFAAEKSEALLFMAVGVAAIAVSGWLWLSRSRWKAMALPLVVIAAIQLTVGGTVYFRTDAQVAALQAQLAADRSAFKQAETVRMDVVVKNFKIYKAIEIALLLAGLALVALMRSRQTLLAVGAGLALQSALMLVLDLFAEARADEYLKFVAGL